MTVSQKEIWLANVAFFVHKMQEYQTETEGSSAESSLLRFLLPDDQKLRDANYVAETTKYLSDLSQFSLDKVAEEPTRLAIEREHIQREMHDLAFKNYKTFIQTSECTREIRNQLSGVSGGIDKTTHHLTDLNVSCQDFISQANKISTKRKAANTTLKQHSTLLELLELPQMIDTCIKSQYYEEALELKQFAARMFRSHPEVKVLKLIYDDVEKATEMMIAQLHQQLSTTTQLAQCSRAIGYLSRLQVYDNREIRVCFLQCRDISMQNVLSLIPTNNAYNYLSKLIDACRAQYFDIITQYKTIFDTSTEEDSSSTTEEDEGILYSWLVHKISDFIQLLKKYLPQISDGSSILNIMNQCMYLGSSLSKAGADFRTLLVPIFEKCILDMFLNTLHTGVDQFTMTIKKFTPPQNTPSSGPVSLNSSFSAPSPTVTPTKEDPSKLQPPRVLIDYVPLALLLNSILQGFNELRKCCPQSLQTPISTALFNALNHVVDLTVNVINAAKPEDKKGYAELCRVTCEEFIPFVARAVVSLFDSPRRLIATEELTNKLIDFYGPTPQNLTKLLLEEKKLQENNSYGSSDTRGSEQTKNEENNTNTTEGTNNTEPVPSANNEKATQDESSSTQATPANADQGQAQAPKDDSTAAVKTTNDVQQQEDATSTERSNEGQVEQAASSSPVEQPKSSENLPNDKSE